MNPWLALQDKSHDKREAEADTDEDHADYIYTSRSSTNSLASRKAQRFCAWREDGDEPGPIPAAAKKTGRVGPTLNFVCMT
ncbi:hypothetical protein A0H81_04646 [Grifola frondosa]|uniref:Uncharacterized protein n=1 Tax=Grifola frondosa TaxID=5627 RepID=A0A1C7ME99_GRIFR|nr:hypothetical protein A0H81_04646 [Grifola frondosa]